MTTKTAYRDLKYLFFGITVGALFSFFGSFTVGFYFRGMDTGDLFGFYIFLAGFISLIVIFIIIINGIEKQSK